MKLTGAIYDEAVSYCALHAPEVGGIFGGRNGVVTDFYPDETAHSTPQSYTPDIERLNSQILCWHANQIEFYGFIHSHPHGVRDLSEKDIAFARAILSAAHQLRWVYSVVGTCDVQGNTVLHPYRITDDQVIAELLVITR